MPKVAGFWPLRGGTVKLTLGQRYKIVVAECFIVCLVGVLGMPDEGVNRISSVF